VLQPEVTGREEEEEEEESDGNSAEKLKEGGGAFETADEGDDTEAADADFDG
jgi:hypothetical protein